LKTIQLKNSGIFAIESIWSEKVDRPFPSVGSVFNVIKENAKDFNYTVLNCNTREELFHSLELAKSNSSKFRTLYFASHGHPYGISLSYSNKDKISLDELAEALGTDFSLWTIHFGSCSVLNVKDSLIKKFMDRTKIKMLTGYGVDVDWMESASFELLFFSYLTYNYSDLAKFRSVWYNRYSNLSDINQFKWYLKGEL
jgi:hypothetical protein